MNLQNLADLVEDTLVVKTNELDARLLSEVKAISPDEHDDFFEYHAEDYLQLADELPTLLRYSVLTGADTGLEVYLDQTCAAYVEVHSPAVVLKDLRGAGIDRARNYLKKVAGMPFPDTDSEWLAVKRLHQLRNAIVHADGYVTADRDEIDKWSSTIIGLEITGAGAIYLKRDFTTAAITAYHAFATRLDAACEKLGLWRFVFPLIEDASAS